jgi:hypothetical protein
MLIWILLFVAIAGTSFLLALRSMKSYREKPSYFTTAYALYLLQKPQNLSDDLLERIGSFNADEKLMLSFERLFKGGRSALVVFGPLNNLNQYRDELGLLELEEYSEKVQGEFKIIEFGLKPNSASSISEFHLNKDDLQLTDSEQIWCQLVARYQVGVGFRVILRVIIQCQNPLRLNELHHIIVQDYSKANLVPLPKPISSGKLIKHYQERAFSGWLIGSNESLALNATEIRRLLLVS